VNNPQKVIGRTKGRIGSDKDSVAVFGTIRWTISNNSGFENAFINPGSQKLHP
jgi:hypothetical protein